MKLGRQKTMNGGSWENHCRVTIYVNNQRKFWASIRSTVKGKQDVGRICDNNGQVLCDEEEVRTRWKDYFASLLESDLNSNTQVLGQRVEQRRDQDANQLDANCTVKISVAEVRECIKRLKNRKAPGLRTYVR